MKKNIKIFLKYSIIFFIVIFILFFALVITAMIPKKAIKDNMIESAKYLKHKGGIEQKLKRREYTYIHYYADSMILNIIYNIDSNKPFKSILMDKYYETEKMEVNYDFIKTIEEQKEPNQQYIRYWHGSMIILRPLLTIFCIEQIYLLNKITIYSLAIILFIVLYKKSKRLAIIYLISLIMIAFPIIPFCLEYSWTFYIMIIVSIIAVLIEKNGDKGLYNLLFVTGMVTCYFDFLSTEIITLFVPIIFVFEIRKKEKRIINFQQGFVFIIKAVILWGLAYVCMWIAKWVLASVVLNINAFEYVKDEAILRINGLQGIENRKMMYLGALYKNIHNLYPINIIKNISKVWMYIIAIFIVIFANLDYKNINKKWFSKLMLIIAFTPYIRYIVLANHSYRHAFFTFRNQIISIVAIGLIVLDCFKYEILNIGSIRRKDEKRINNINSCIK